MGSYGEPKFTLRSSSVSLSSSSSSVAVGSYRWLPATFHSSSVNAVAVGVGGAYEAHVPVVKTLLYPSDFVALWVRGAYEAHVPVVKTLPYPSDSVALWVRGAYEAYVPVVKTLPNPSDFVVLWARGVSSCTARLVVFARRQALHRPLPWSAVLITGAARASRVGLAAALLLGGCSAAPGVRYGLTRSTCSNSGDQVEASEIHGLGDVVSEIFCIRCRRPHPSGPLGVPVDGRSAVSTVPSAVVRTASSASAPTMPTVRPLAALSAAVLVAALSAAELEAAS